MDFDPSVGASDSESEEVAPDFDIPQEDTSSEDEDGLAGGTEDSGDEAAERRLAIEEEKGITHAWGKKRNAYYSTDYVDSEADADEAEKLEELEGEEARALQKEYLEDLDEDDMALPQTLLPLGQRLQAGRKGKTPKGAKAGSDREALRALKSELDAALDGAAGDEAVERVVKDLSGLSKQQKLKFLQRNFPELAALAQELASRLRAPQHLAAQGSDDPQTELRRQVELSYLANLCFYFYLQQGDEAALHTHPVMQHLLQCRQWLQSQPAAPQEEKLSLSVKAPKTKKKLTKPKTKKKMKRQSEPVQPATKKKKRRRRL